MKNKSSTAWLWLFSLTYKLAEKKKRELFQKTDGKSKVTKAIKRYNLYYFSVTIGLSILAQLLFEQKNYSHSQYKYINYSICILVGWFIFVSRGIEIFKAFLDDAVDKLNHEPSHSELKFGDRLSLAFRSYIELMVGFGTLYYILPSNMMKEGFDNIINSIYFSGVTMTTIGYGDNSPTSIVTQILVIFQAFCGLTLALVSFTVYTSLALSHTENLEERSDEDG